MVINYTMEIISQVIFDNFTHSILNIEAIKAYDESYVDEKYPNWNDQSSYTYYNFDDYTLFN